MNRFDLVSAIGLFVLTAGLASCSKEQEKAKDTYRVPPPVIVTGKGNQGLLLWERESDKTLDLQDAFDVSAGNPARTEVTARCMREKASLSARFTVNGRRPVRILQVVPREILFDDLAKSAVTCDWEVILSNELGSKHVIRLPTAPISDRGNPEVLVENSGNTDKIRTLQVMKTEGIKIRHRNSEPASAEILCRDVSFDPLPFEKVIELSRFDLRRPIYRPGRTDSHIEQTPLQSCRILISEGGQLRSFSPLMMIHIPRKPLNVSVKNLIATNPYLNINYLNQVSTPFVEVSIQNPSSTARVLQIPRVLNWQMLSIVSVKKDSKWDMVNAKRTTITVPWMNLQLMTPVPVMRDEAAGWTISLPPQGTLVVRLNFKIDYSACYQTNEYFVAIAFPSQNLTANEIMPSGELIQPLVINLPEFWHQMTRSQFESTPQREARCI